MSDPGISLRDMSGHSGASIDRYAHTAMHTVQYSVISTEDQTLLKAFVVCNPWFSFSFI